jgi:L-malate glycosyltransferase
MSAASIFSPVPEGCGAAIIHQSLAGHIPGYCARTYNPYWTLLPILLPLVASSRCAAMVHCPPDYACFLAERKVPLVLTFHNYVLDQWMRPYSSRLQTIHYRTDLKWWTRLSVKHATRITAVSNFIADLVRRELNPGKDISVIHNGVDTERFRPVSGLSNKGDKKIRVFFSGNLTLRKGAQWLPAIADRLDKHIMIYYTAGLRTRKKLPERPNLISVGSIPFKDMPERYRDMDILLTPTVREGFGLAVAEAMASRLPVVASNCWAIPELVDDGRGGCLCPVGDVKAFAEKLNFLAASPGLRKEMGAYNREKAEQRFSLRRMIGEYVRLFDSLRG